MKRIAVVDDDEDIRVFLRHVLGDEGYAVIEFANATAFLNAPPAAFDLAIIDLMMPAIDGIDTIARFAKHAIPVVALSAGDTALLARAITAGAVAALEKLDAEELVATVGRILEKRK